MRRKVFSIAALTLICTLSLFAVGSSNNYVGNLLNSVKNYSLPKVFFADEGKNTSKKTLIAGRKSRSVGYLPETAAVVNPTVPDKVVYFVLFNHLVGLKAHVNQQAYFNETAPIDYYDLYKKQANLNDYQSQSLFQTAQNCMDAIQPIDAQAKSVIDQARTAFPAGAFDSEQALPPPPELIQLQQQKDNTVLYYRDQLRNSLGDAKFAEFNQFTKEKVAPQIEELPSSNFGATGGTE